MVIGLIWVDWEIEFPFKGSAYCPLVRVGLSPWQWLFEVWEKCFVFGALRGERALAKEPWPSLTMRRSPQVMQVRPCWPRQTPPRPTIRPSIWAYWMVVVTVANPGIDMLDDCQVTLSWLFARLCGRSGLRFSCGV